MKRAGAGLVVGLGLAFIAAAQTPEAPASPSGGWLVEGVRAQEAAARAKHQGAETTRRPGSTEPRPDLPATTAPTPEPLWERMLQRWTASRDRTPAADAPRGPNPFLPEAPPPPQPSVTGTTPSAPAGPSAETPAAPRLADAVPDAGVEAPRREPHRPPAPDRDRERYYRQLPKKF